MSAETADNAGTPQLKLLVMENIKKFPRGISDQVISSPDSREVVDSVHPGPGQQASSAKLLEPQAASVKTQAQRLKLQAASIKLSNH